MKIPKTPIAFDYDLWTTEDGKCMVRVKRTGEVSEVDRKVLRILRAEEKRIRRSYCSDNTSEDEDLSRIHIYFIDKVAVDYDKVFSNVCKNQFHQVPVQWIIKGLEPRKLAFGSVPCHRRFALSPSHSL